MEESPPPNLLFGWTEERLKRLLLWTYISSGSRTPTGEKDQSDGNQLEGNVGESYGGLYWRDKIGNGRSIRVISVRGYANCINPMIHNPTRRWYLERSVELRMVQIAAILMPETDLLMKTFN